MQSNITRPAVVAAILLLPMSIVLVLAQGGSVWAGIVGWLAGALAIAVVVLVLRVLKVVK